MKICKYEIAPETPSKSQFYNKQLSQSFGNRFSVERFKKSRQGNICQFCYNCTVDNELTFDNDLSYCSVGDMKDGFNMSIRSGGKRKTVIMISHWNDEKQENETIGIYELKFCPECGRKLKENNK